MYGVILHLTSGILMTLVGFGIIDGKWKSTEDKIKYEKILKVTGIFVIIIGIMRFIWEMFIKN